MGVLIFKDDELQINPMNTLKYILLFLIVAVIPITSFSQPKNTVPNLNANQNIKVLELRNYLVRYGRRDEFINLFEENFVQSQNILGGYILGQYRIKGADDNFFWIRGFRDMPARYKFLNDFYISFSHQLKLDLVSLNTFDQFGKFYFITKVIQTWFNS